MYNKISGEGITAEELKAHEKEWGNYNDAPTGFTEITAEEFAQSGFFTWCKEAIEFRQICRFNGAKLFNQTEGKKSLHGWDKMLAVTMFFMNHGDHYAVANDYWASKVRYFKFATCFHDYQELTSTRMCWHVCKCTKCGHVWEYDSSD